MVSLILHVFSIFVFIYVYVYALMCFGYFISRGGEQRC